MVPSLVSGEQGGLPYLLLAAVRRPEYLPATVTKTTVAEFHSARAESK